MGHTSSSFSPDILQAGCVPAFTFSEAPARDAELVGVPAECEARQQPPREGREGREDHVAPVHPQTIPFVPPPQQQLQGICSPIGVTCDPPRNRFSSPENTSSGSSAGTNQITTDCSSESPRGTCRGHSAQTPGMRTRTARMRTTLPMDAPYIEEVAPEKGPVTGGIRIFIIGDHFPEGDHLYVRFGNAFARAVSAHLATWFIWKDDDPCHIEAAQRAYFVVSPPPRSQCW